MVANTNTPDGVFNVTAIFLVKQRLDVTITHRGYPANGTFSGSFIVCDESGGYTYLEANLAAFDHLVEGRSYLLVAEELAFVRELGDFAVIARKVTYDLGTTTFPIPAKAIAVGHCLADPVDCPWDDNCVQFVSEFVPLRHMEGLLERFNVDIVLPRPLADRIRCRCGTSYYASGDVKVVGDRLAVVVDHFTVEPLCAKVRGKPCMPEDKADKDQKPSRSLKRKRTDTGSA